MIILDKIIVIVGFYKTLIKDLIDDIKSYYLTIIIGGLILTSTIVIIVATLKDSHINNYNTIAGSIISTFGSYIINLFFSNIEKIRISEKKKRKNKNKALNYYNNRHSSDSLIQDNIEKEYLVVTLNPPIE